MGEGAGQHPAESSAAERAQASPDELKKDVAARVQAAPDERKKEVAAAAVRAVPDELKDDVAAAAVQAAPDELKKDVTAAAVQAAPDAVKKDVTAAAVQAVPEDMKDSAAAAAVEAVLTARDSERSELAETVARAVLDELRGPPPVNYEGWIGIDVVGKGDRKLKIKKDRSLSIRRGIRYSLVVTIGTDANARLALPLRISGGDDAEQVEFSVMLNGDDPELRKPPQSVTVATAGGSDSASFPLEVQGDGPKRLWVRVAQRGQFIQHIELKIPRRAKGLLMPTSKIGPLIATLTFEESKNGHLGVRSEFKSGDVVELPDIGDMDTIKDAYRRAGKYLGKFADKVAAAPRGNVLSYQLDDAFNYLFDQGCQLGLRLTDGDADEFGRMQRAFMRSWPGWRHPRRDMIPTIQLVGPEAALAFPLELVPIFDFGTIPPLENASVLTKVASRFLGFTAVVCRVVRNTDRCSDVLHNIPALPVQFVRYLDLGRYGSTVTGFVREAEFLLSLKERGLVTLDGPWPTDAVPAGKVVDRLVDALYHPAKALCRGSMVDGPVQLAHFACHCITEGHDDDEYELKLSTETGAPRPVKLHEIRTGYVQRSAKGKKPEFRAPVILNACGSSTVHPGSLLSFQHHFLKNGHRAFVGTQAAIDDADAADYAERLYRFLLGGYTLGEAVVLARRQLLADTGSPLGLLYVQYGNDQFAVEKAHKEELPMAC